MPAYLTTRADLPTSHHMVHPGIPNPSRLDFTQLQDVISEKITVPAGETLHDAIIAAAKKMGGECGVASLSGGAFSATRFTTGGPPREGKAANYTTIRHYGATEIVRGNICFGLAEDAPHFVHCHAKLRKHAHGEEQGGHFFAPDCVISEPITAEFNVFTSNTITKRASAETLHAIFEINQPGFTTEDDGFGREFFIRVHPNEDLPTALEAFCKTQSIQNALIGTSLGSLNEPALSMRGQVQKITSVGTEAISLSGDVLTNQNGEQQAAIMTILVDEHGTEFSGYLIKGHSPVCITAEIYLMEIVDQSLINAMREVRDATI